MIKRYYRYRYKLDEDGQICRDSVNGAVIAIEETVIPGRGTDMSELYQIRQSQKRIRKLLEHESD